MYYHRKDPLNLQSLHEGTESTFKIRNTESKLIEFAQMEQTKHLYNFQIAEEDRNNLKKLIVESTKRGIFPITFKENKHMESEVSQILNDIFTDLQTISNLSIFVMTKQICYKFYLLYRYEKRAPQYIVPAAFLLATRIISNSYNNFVTEKLVEFYFTDKESLFQEKNIILDTLGPHMACLKDPVKFIRDICQKQNQTHVLTEAYKLINQMEPNKFQTMIPYDIANLAVDIALENINKVANHTTGKMVPKENKMEPSSTAVHFKVGYKINQQHTLLDQDLNNQPNSTLETNLNHTSVEQNKSQDTLESNPDLAKDKVEWNVTFKKTVQKEESKGQSQITISPTLNEQKSNLTNQQMVDNPNNLLRENSTNAETKGNQRNCHATTNNVGQPYKCKICNVNFRYMKKRYEQHLSKCERKNNIFNFKCTCGKSFPRKFSLQRHISLFKSRGLNCQPLQNLTQSYK